MDLKETPTQSMNRWQKTSSNVLQIHDLEGSLKSLQVETVSQTSIL